MEPRETVRVYDVRKLSERLMGLRRVGRGVAWSGLGVGLVSICISVISLLLNSSLGPLYLKVIGIAFGIGVSGISMWAILRWRPGAERVMIDAVGVHLYYRGERVVHLRWSDPRLSFVLEDGSVLPTEITKGGLLYTLNVGTGDTPLTEEAFFDVLAQARQRGLVAHSGRDRVPLMPANMWLMDYHIRGPGHPVPPSDKTA